MNRYLLLILLSSWSHVVPLSWQCDTGVANPDHKLSIAYSLMANADVALIKTFKAVDLQDCLKECCIEKYGSCSVASFKKNVSEDNCQHFNCRPILKCKFVSSNSTDSFSFSSTTLPQHTVPSNHASQNRSSTLASTSGTTIKPKLHDPLEKDRSQAVKEETAATFSAEQFDLKNDNTTIKPRKGVDSVTANDAFESTSESITKSGVKPRKGVTFSDIKSKVKPRKGVEPYDTALSSPTATSSVAVFATKSGHSSSSSTTGYKNLADDLVSALEKVFEDDTREKDIDPSVSSSELSALGDVMSTAASYVVHSSMSTHSVVPSVLTHHLESSFSSKYILSSSFGTPSLQTTFIQSTETMNYTLMPSTTSSLNILEHSKLLFHEGSEEFVESEKMSETKETNESENERKYKSSMHLVLSLIFGLLVLFSVLGVIAKKVYDGWLRRHYRRMDFLIDGMYNGYG